MVKMHDEYSMMTRAAPTLIEIDLAALRHNYLELKKRLGTGTKTLAVVKSNAYGHGAVPVARTLQALGADLFGVGTVDEGVQLREAGIKRPILILLGLIDGKFPELVRYNLTPIVYDLGRAAELNKFLEGRAERLDIHIKVDTGMTRLGVAVQEAARFFDELKEMKGLVPRGLATHLADADDKPFSNRQVVNFEKARMEFQSRFPSAQYHVASSLASIDRRFPYDACRLGIALYGAYPVKRQSRLVSLQPVMHWKTRLIAIRKVPKGTAVSYGRTYQTQRESRIGVVPVGYADGYLRLLSNRAFVLVRGVRVPVAGTICMDMFMIDVSKIAGVKVGDEVVLIGSQGRETITAEELGKWGETISYELFCRIAERIPRHTLG